MKKRVLSFCVVVLILLVFSLSSLSACSTSEHTHIWVNSYTDDGELHYQTCSGCAEKKYSNHSYDSNDVCVCGKRKSVEIEHTHIWSSTYTNDADSHYQTCSGCLEKKYSNHSYNSNGVCVCGKRKPVENIEIADIAFDSLSLNMLTGKQIELTLHIYPSNAIDKTIIWQSTNSSIVSVNNGIITAKAPGKASVIARTLNGKEARCEITVEQAIPVQQIILYHTELDLLIGYNGNIGGTYLPRNANDIVFVWQSSNTSVVEVDSKGYYVATGLGTAEITVTAPSGVKGRVKVTVHKSIPITIINLSSILDPIMVGDTFQVQYSYSPSTASADDLIWTSENPDIATVDDHGLITAVAPGAATIVCSSKSGAKASVEIVCSYYEWIAPEAPLTIKNYSNPAYYETQSAIINSIEIEFLLERTSYLYITLNITKTSCMTNASKSFKIGVKIYNEKDELVKSDTMSTDPFTVGETTTVRKMFYIDKNLFTDGKYRITFVPVSW